MNAKTNPSSKGTRMLPPVQTNTNMSTFNSTVFLTLPCRSSSTRRKSVKKQGGKHNACYQSATRPPYLPPTSHCNGCKAYKKARRGPYVGCKRECERSRRMSESYPHIAGSCPARIAILHLRPSTATCCTPRGRPLQRAKRASHSKAGCGGRYSVEV
jgi:hypothetical protein